MKTTTVPAQVTTVEDRIAGNLNFTQLFILSLPLFISGAIYIALPPFIHMPIYKIVIACSVLLVCFTLAIRVRGKLVGQWLNVMYRYNSRPRYYIYNKNSTYLRNIAPKSEPKKETATVSKKAAVHTHSPLGFVQRVKAEGLVANPQAQTRFEISKQGGLRVRITEVKQEG